MGSAPAELGAAVEAGVVLGFGHEPGLFVIEA